MKPTTYHFAQPITVIQAFHYHYDYYKDQRRLQDRKDAAAWQPMFASASGYVSNGELYLPETIAQAAGLAYATHITLEDIQNKAHYHFKNLPANCCLNLSKGLVDYDSFKLKTLAGGAISIELNWSFKGYFTPQQYKIGELQPGMVLEVRRNRQVDFSLTGRKERTYTEAFTMLEILGTFSQATLLRQPFETVAKPLPCPTKTVDLMKHLH